MNKPPYVISFLFFLGHTIVVCFLDNLVWNQMLFLWPTPGHLDIMYFEACWKPGPNKDNDDGRPTKRMENKDQGASYKTTYPNRFLTLDPASTVAVCRLYWPPDLSLYYNFIPMD